MTEPLEYPYAAQEQATKEAPAGPGPEEPEAGAETGGEVAVEPAVAEADADTDGGTVEEPEAAAAPAAEAAPVEPDVAEPAPEPDLEAVPAEALPEQAVAPLLRGPDEHAAAELDIPDGYGVLEGAPSGARRAVAVVVARFNGEITSRLLASALDELERAGVERDAITVVPVPGAFELPLASMAFAKTRRYACVVALGCVIRGETAHFDYVAGEAASGLQLAALETGVPVAFGVLTTETVEQAEARVDRGADAVRTALEMADLFAQLRTAAASA
jgi:6,7-dimethyl-8-ribityllumazine synthase